MKRKELVRKRVQEQLKEYNGAQIINPIKRVLKEKPYENRDHQSVYEYVKIKLGDRK